MDVLIVDDEKYVLDEVKKLLKTFEEQTEHSIKIREAASYEALRIELVASSPDLIILDIELQDKNGLDIKNELEKDVSNSLIVFLTNFAQNMPSAFGRNVIGFFEKPLDYGTLAHFMERAVSLVESDKIIELEKGRCILSSKIRYIRVKDIYTEVYTADSNVFSVRRSLGDWHDKLADVGFIRISNEYLVNCSYIDNINDTCVVLEESKGVGGEKLQISRRRKKYCILEYAKYCRKMARYVR